MPAPIELYYWPTPNGWKITIMLEELGVPYEVKYVNIGAGGNVNKRCSLMLISLRR